MLILLVVVVALVLYLISTYNNLQTLKTQISASVQEIGNQLKRQASLIPNLSASVKGYLKHEKDIYQMISNARLSVESADKTGKLSDIDQAIDRVQALTPKIQVLLESNPELKGDKTIHKFMEELTDTADKLSYARRSLIDLTQRYNEMLSVFPSNFIAKQFGFKPENGLTTPTTGAHLVVSEEETKDVKADF